MDQVEFGKRVAQVRKARNLTTKELGERLSLSHSHLRLVENGQKMLSVPALIDLCRELQITPNFLFQAELPDNIELSGKIDKLLPGNRKLVEAMIQFMLEQQELDVE